MDIKQVRDSAVTISQEVGDAAEQLEHLLDDMRAMGDGVNMLLARGFCEGAAEQFKAASEGLAAMIPALAIEAKSRAQQDSLRG